MNYDFFIIAFKNITHRKLRSWLTVIGIIIGIASIISLISISQGLENAIKAQFEKMGSDRIYVFPKTFSDPSQTAALKQEDADELEKVSELEYIAPYFSKKAKVEYQREEKIVTIIGWPSELSEKLFGDYDLDFAEGFSFPTKASYSAVLGYKAATDLFDTKIGVKNRIVIQGNKFRVSGILKEIGSPDDDNSIYIPLSIMRDIFNDKDSLTAIDAKVKPGFDIDKVAEKMEKALERKRDKETFEVSTAEQLLAQLGDILKIVQVVLAGIASISLLVGGVGIMNSMYTSVLERTKDIGIMKSIGAKNSDILSIFMIESAFMGFVGGLLGVFLGSLISLLVGFIAKQSGFLLLKIIIDYKLLMFALSFSFVVGVLSGLLPAIQASKLKPVDALRY